MATPTFEQARKWFETYALKFSSKEDRANAYCKHFKLKEPLVIAKSGKESDWTKSGRMLGALQEGLNLPGAIKPRAASAATVASGPRGSKLGMLRELFQEASSTPSMANWEQLGRQALAILFPVQMRKTVKQEAKDAKKLDRVSRLNLSLEGKAKLLAQLQKELSPNL